MVTKNTFSADDTESSLSEYSEDEQGQLYKKSTRKESIVLGDSDSHKSLKLKTRSSKVFDDLKTVTDELLDIRTRKTLFNTMNQITRFGNRKSTTLGQCRDKLCEIVAQNGRIELLYNEYARLHAASEKRKSYQLPFSYELRKTSRDEEQSETQAESSGETVEINAQAEAAIPAPGRLQSSTIASGVTEIQEEHKKYSLPISHCAILPVTNTEAFPLDRIQEVQAQRYPSTQIISMWSHCDANGIVTQVTADIEQGSIDHLIIRDPRHIAALGLRNGAQDTISWNDSELKMDETFIIHVFPGQRSRSPKAWILGELQSARHAYLYWLDHRRSADPKTGPYAQEARTLARKLSRRAPHVFNEIKNAWEMEQGPCGWRYRENRIKYLGEDPSYARDAEGHVCPISMWG